MTNVTLPHGTHARSVGAPALEGPCPFGLVIAASKIQDSEEFRRLLDGYVSALRALGGEVSDAASAPAELPLVVFVATGGTEGLILQAIHPEVHAPLLLVAHPGHNSLPAALETLARVQQLGFRGKVHYLRGADDRDGLERLAGAIRDASVRQALLECRIGLVGQPSDWLVASSPSFETVRSVWGPTIVPLPLDPLLSRVDAEAAAHAEAFAKDFRAGAEAVTETADSDLLAAGRVHASLREMVESQRLDAVTVRCFDLVIRERRTGCLALARLNEEGVVAGCEGDVVSTVAMLWLRLMLGGFPWMANPSRVDLDRGVLTLAHCTVPRGAVSAYSLRSHFESGLGAAIQGVMPTGPVTLVRIGGERMESLRAIDGVLVRNTTRPDLCRTQVEVEVGRDALEELLVQPLGNHIVLGAGWHSEALRRWHAAMIA